MRSASIRIAHRRRAMPVRMCRYRTALTADDFERLLEEFLRKVPSGTCCVWRDGDFVEVEYDDSLPHDRELAEFISKTIAEGEVTVLGLSDTQGFWGGWVITKGRFLEAFSRPLVQLGRETVPLEKAVSALRAPRKSL